MHWTREDGLPFDPWIRLHARLGAEILAVAERSLDISGSVAEWESWTGMSFPEDGDYVVPGALVPVQVRGRRRPLRRAERLDAARAALAKALDAKRLELSRRGAVEDDLREELPRDRAEGDAHAAVPGGDVEALAPGDRADHRKAVRGVRPKARPLEFDLLRLPVLQEGGGRADDRVDALALERLVDPRQVEDARDPAGRRRRCSSRPCPREVERVARQACRSTVAVML